MIFSLPRGTDDGVYSINDEPYAALGECYSEHETDSDWVYCKADVALAKGEAIKGKIITLATALGASVAAGTHKLPDSAAAFNTTLARVPTDGAKNYENAEIHIGAGTGAGQNGTILSYTNKELTIYWDSDNGTLQTALVGGAGDATDSQYQLIIPWLAVKATGADNVMGFAQRDVEAGKYFWALNQGRGVAHTGEAIAAADVSGELNISATTAGAVIAQVATLLTPGCATAKSQAPDDSLVLIDAHCRERPRRVRFMGRTGPYIQSYQDPPAA